MSPSVRVLWLMAHSTIGSMTLEIFSVVLSSLNKFGHLFVCKQSKRGWDLQISYSYFVMSQLYVTKIPYLCI
jgi:hypothetical protein